MSEIDNTTNKSKNTKTNKDSNDAKASNIIFYCEQCKKTPLIIPSNINYKMIKYCNIEKTTELITPINLLNMINIKYNKKKDMSKDSLKINENNINWDEFICSKHGKEFINYCDDCSEDLCYICSKEHSKHKLIYFSNFLPTNKDIRDGKKILTEMKNDLEKFKQNTKEIIKICESLIYLKEIIINSLNSMDYKQINFNSIMNYQNILKLKIKLNDNLYNVINPLFKNNSNLLNSIKNKFENKGNSFNEKNIQNNYNKIIINDLNIICDNNKLNNLKKPNNKYISKINIDNSYQNYLKILEKAFEFDKTKQKFDNDFDVNSCADNKIKNYKINEDINLIEDNAKHCFKIEIKNDFYSPIKPNKAQQQKNKFNQDNIFKNYKLGLFQDKIFDKSTILEDRDINFILSLISSKVGKNIKKLYLCYRASKDGDLAENFHKKCDYIKNIIILISTKQNTKFGGFSTESWDSNNNNPWKKDEHSFIFSLNNYDSYNVINPDKAILCNRQYGPIFGIGEIFIRDKFFMSLSSCQEQNLVYESKGNSYALNKEKEFLVNQMEAYTVDFE